MYYEKRLKSAQLRTESQVLQVCYGVSILRACQVLKCQYSTYYYRIVADEQAALKVRIKIAQSQVSYGYRLTHIMLQREGWKINHKRVYRGSQYCSYEYRDLLDSFGLTASMSRKGNCFNNAPMESFWGTLKQELVHLRRYRTKQEAIRDIAEHIEIFYNRQRRQARLSFL